ncbi:hypothetical protein GUJ93_ZPchr0006g43157 [Zizania palustris]|uniref:Uncharacterized protein n=1 Tax=Zizania palustris TaxID=103762 RepID=A0A8J5T127_ZIZPA|nr:hypothetical protein GUJ93_ZPchr0006g44229 [Zizania palustris]KAG8076105.1 hypothetical protein GUJ93_ZPchr0006g43157 [Zizania palustris]
MESGVAGELLLLLPGGEEDQLELRVEELEHLLGDVLQTLSRLDTKRGRLQGQIAAASRGKPRRRAADHPPHGARAPAPAPAVAYTRKGAGAVRRRLIAAAGDVDRERERLEAMWEQLEAALVDARERLTLAEQLRLGGA